VVYGQHFETEGPEYWSSSFGIEELEVEVEFRPEASVDSFKLRSVTPCPDLLLCSHNNVGKIATVLALLSGALAAFQYDHDHQVA